MEYFDSLEKYGDRTALRTEEGNVSYHELVTLADDIVSKLPKRSLLMIFCTNSVPSIAGYVGSLRAGVVPILINNKVDKTLLGGLYDTYKPYAVLTPSGTWTGSELNSAMGYSLYKTDFDVLPALMDDLALLLSTSGSTGSPKLVKQTNVNIKSNTEAIIEYLGILDSDNAITMLQMNYTYGLSVINSHLCAGANIFVTEKTFFDRDIWDVFRKYEISSFGGVPYTYEMLKRLSFLKEDFPALRYITQAGGKLDNDLQLEYAQAMRNAGKAFIVMYGATEATARMAYLPAEYAVEKAGCMGIAIPGGRFEIIDVDDTVINEPNKAGELIYYGPNVTPGYVESIEDLAKPDERNSRLETGDFAQIDADGFYMIVGRKSRFLKIFGNRVNLMEVEKILHDKGWESACTGKDNHMEIYTTETDMATVQNFIASKLKFHSSAFAVYHIDEIPRNESGKVQYKKLNAQG